MINGSEILGKRLKSLRSKTGKNQADIAKSIGISRARYSHYENNHVEPDIDLIRKLANLYDVSIDYLLGNTDNPARVKYEDRDEITNKIATEFPDVDLMFKDMENMTAKDFQEVYEFVKFKKSQKEE